MHSYREGNKYTLGIDFYTKISLLCTFVDDTFAYLIDNTKNINYKQHLKNHKLYKFNTHYQSWDTVESNLVPVTDHDYYTNNRLSAMNDFKGD